MPRSPRMGRRRRASATERSSMGTPAAAPRGTSRASCSASRSVRAILSAPLCVKRRGLAGLLRERGELARPPLGELGERRRGADLAREPRRAGRGLGGEGGALQYRHARAAPGQVIGDAGAKGAGADDHDVGGVDHETVLLTMVLLLLAVAPPLPREPPSPGPVAGILPRTAWRGRALCQAGEETGGDGKRILR